MAASEPQLRAGNFIHLLPSDQVSGLDNGDYHPQIMSFTNPLKGDVFHINYIAQAPEADRIWPSCILDESQGFPKAGEVRLNESIRTYVWCILGVQEGNPNQHHRHRDRIWRPEGVSRSPGKTHLLPSRHPGVGRSVSECAPVRTFQSGLRLWV